MRQNINELEKNNIKTANAKEFIEIDTTKSLKDAVEEFEKLFLIKAKERWRTTDQIAQAVGVDQSTISRKLRKYNI